MATGKTFLITAKSGCLIRTLAGHRIATGIGFGSPTMAGRGYRMSRGVGHRITMADGSSTAEIGRGGRVRWASMEAGAMTPSGLLLTSRSLVGATA